MLYGIECSLSDNNSLSCVIITKKLHKIPCHMVIHGNKAFKPYFLHQFVIWY